MNYLSEYKLFVQRIGLIGITNILIAISSIILLPIITKSFSTSDYGIWVQIMTTIALMSNIASLGLPYTMVRFLSAEKDREKIQEGFYSLASIVLASTVTISVLLLIFSNSIAAALFNGEVNIVISLSVIVLFACLNAFLLNFFRTFQQMKRYSLFLLSQTYLGILIVSYFVWRGFSIDIVVLGYLIAYILTFLLMSIFIIYNIGFKIPRFKNIREYLTFGLPTIPSNLSYWIVDSSDRYVIGILLGTVFVGYYSPAYTLGNIILMVLAPFSLLLPSVLPKYYEENDLEQVNFYLKYSLKYFLLIAIPAAFGLSVLSKSILLILTTPEIALNGYTVTPFVTLSALLFGVYAITSNIIILKKKTKFIGTLWVIAAILNVVLNFLIVPYVGIIGAAAVTLFTYAVAFTLSMIYSNRFLKFEFDYPFIIKSLISSFVMSMVIIWINPLGIMNVILVALVGALIYFAILFSLRGIEKEEFKFFKGLLGS